MQQLIADIFTYFSGSISLIFGLVYLFKKSFLNYHKNAIDTNWKDLNFEFQTLILALMRAVSGGAIAVGFTIIILQYNLNPDNRNWMAFIILISGFIISICSLYAMLMVRLQTKGKPPMIIIFLSLILLSAGFFLNTNY
ncbi:hypothetical protein GKZ90_0006380 [Flavobacterium sp. MC2016-06]|jgi:hypothetical protein|uniref:hypothetical protein n=1 Tax=Flavobacterium sp. MC2016-06 TaxID=2676308 RepID=UPI0012BA93AF|nr:hypothetical protein [Flavobacterium sp. MC2016-06]MBU3857765.1 hypothetical protein [Flavobacterium sp. MC2016-06]